MGNLKHEGCGHLKYNEPPEDLLQIPGGGRILTN